jgi:hypothetical protein
MIFVDIECEKCHCHVHGVMETPIKVRFICFNCRSVLKVYNHFSLMEKIKIFFQSEIQRTGHIVKE